jgi:hypothetical protein
MGGSSKPPEPRAGYRRAIALATVVALVGSAATAGASVLDGPGSDLPVVVDETVEGGTAVSLTVELSGPALYRIDLVGDGPRDGTVISMGFVAFDEQRTYDGLFAIATFDSQDRQRTVVAGESMPVPSSTVPDDGEALSAVLPSEDGDERACPLACASRLELPERTEAGVYHHGLWMGGVDETRLQIIADENVTDVELEVGTPLAVGSEDFADGHANVQHQPSTQVGDDEVFAGAKAMHGAELETAVEDRLYGVAGLAEFKTACVGTCASTDTARGVCGARLPADCRTAQMTWQGPAISGAGDHRVFSASDPGTYTFGVERMVDAYGSSTPVVADYAYADPGEHHPYVGGADLPDPPLLDRGDHDASS